MPTSGPGAAVGWPTGICIRLYSEDDFDARPEFTEPEILRTNLASVILQMISLELGDLDRVPVRRAPGRPLGQRRSRAAAGARRADRGHRSGRHGLSEVGRALAALPVDPRLGRMLVEADRTGCLREVLVIAAALSVQDPRERPTEQRQAADARHARFAGEFTAGGTTLDAAGSDFLAFVNLWSYLAEQRAALSGNRFRRLLREEFLHYLRIREWQDLHAQLRSAARSAGMPLRRQPEPTRTGSTSRCSPGCSARSGCWRRCPTGRADGRQPGARGRRAGREYLGARGAKFMIFPGSPLARKPPRWVMAAELVETSRLFARTVARISPEWIEPLAGHLVRRSYSEPHWSRKRAAAVATERVTLHGIPIVVGRTVDFGRIDPELSRELFIRHALVEGDWDTRHRFFHANRELLDDVEELEHRARRRDLVVDEETLVALLRPADPGRRDLRAALRPLVEDAPRAGSRSCSTSPRRCCAPRRPPPSTAPPIPTTSTPAGSPCRCRTRSSRARAPTASPSTCRWPRCTRLTRRRSPGRYPGLREELVTALIKTLPKPLRRQFCAGPRPRAGCAGPAAAPPVRTRPNRCSTAWSASWAGCAASHPARRPGSWTGCPSTSPSPSGWSTSPAPSWPPAPTCEALRRGLAPQVRAELAAAGEDLERTGLTTWSIGTLPREHPIRRGSHVVTGYPGLVDRGVHCGRASGADGGRARPGDVARPAPAAAARHPVAGASRCSASLDNAAKLALSRNPHGSVRRAAGRTASPPRPTR